MKKETFCITRLCAVAEHDQYSDSCISTSTDH